MKKFRALKLLKAARGYAAMEHMSVSNICVNPRSAPTFEDGRRVTEANVSDFIRERTRIYRESWLISAIDEVTKLVEAA